MKTSSWEFVRMLIPNLSKTNYEHLKRITLPVGCIEYNVGKKQKAASMTVKKITYQNVSTAVTRLLVKCRPAKFSDNRLSNDGIFSTALSILCPRMLPLLASRRLCASSNGFFVLSNLLRGVERLDKHIYRCSDLIEGVVASQRIFGGQVIGQALNACADTVPERFLPNSLHTCFLKGGKNASSLLFRTQQSDTNKPVLYLIQPQHDSATRCCRSVVVKQQEDTIISLSVVYQKPESVLEIHHEDKMPEAPDPDQLPKCDSWFHTYLKLRGAEEIDYMIVDMLTKGISHTFDYREIQFYNKSNLNLPRNLFWVKAHESLKGSRPCIHHAVSSYISDTLMIAAALRPHVELFTKVTQIASLNHCVWFHRHDFSSDQWMLYETLSTVAGKDDCSSWKSGICYRKNVVPGRSADSVRFPGSVGAYQRTERLKE
ncbi:Acyl-CoA thioesterase 2 [Trichinella spiralis]|uniref:Acyl-CoA thioesterase 2 n=2 Tax=Trichinella spiralis TaxID=6334 RepID=A0A0V1B1G1_TRISP|nr:Acyl-CoA thioesterase 2 [Trichinella spiralis]